MCLSVPSIQGCIKELLLHIQSDIQNTWEDMFLGKTVLAGHNGAHTFNSAFKAG